MSCSGRFSADKVMSIKHTVSNERTGSGSDARFTRTRLQNALYTKSLQLLYILLKYCIFFLIWPQVCEPSLPTRMLDSPLVGPAPHFQLRGPQILNTTLHLPNTNLKCSSSLFCWHFCNFEWVSWVFGIYQWWDKLRNVTKTWISKGNQI